mmetsp:Transcript_26323/g.59358  ORF Transcript_26323/g.59358 Transcript_26323/m.59358 type:complete len:91 (+) Transcript_26323:281-553(+)
MRYSGLCIGSSVEGSPGELRRLPGRTDAMQQSVSAAPSVRRATVVDLPRAEGSAKDPNPSPQEYELRQWKKGPCPDRRRRPLPPALPRLL